MKIFVSNAGDDNNTGLDLDNAVRNIGEAESRLSSFGDLIILVDGLSMVEMEDFPFELEKHPEAEGYHSMVRLETGEFVTFGARMPTQ